MAIANGRKTRPKRSPRSLPIPNMATATEPEEKRGVVEIIKVSEVVVVVVVVVVDVRS